MNIQESVMVLKAMADESRLRIAGALMSKPHYVEELAELLSLSESTVSFHLKKLEGAGLVCKKKEQYYYIYSIRHEFIKMKLVEFLSFENPEKNIQEKRISEYRQKVIETFFRHGKLIKIPVQNKKRIIILKEIASEFSTGIHYTELEIDRTLEKFHDDYCSLRRYMIDESIMKRRKGEYWIEEEYSAYNKTSIKKPDIKMDSKKELKRKYKETPLPMGIIKVTNIQSGKVFIASGMNTKALINRNEAQLKFKAHYNTELQADYNRLGEKNFSFEIIDILERKEDPEYDYKEDLKELETLWIEKLNCYAPVGYNKKPVRR